LCRVFYTVNFTHSQYRMSRVRRRLQEAQQFGIQLPGAAAAAPQQYIDPLLGPVQPAAPAQPLVEQVIVRDPAVAERALSTRDRLRQMRNARLLEVQERGKRAALRERIAEQEQARAAEAERRGRVAPSKSSPGFPARHRADLPPDYAAVRAAFPEETMYGSLSATSFAGEPTGRYGLPVSGPVRKKGPAPPTIFAPDYEFTPEVRNVERVDRGAQRPVGEYYHPFDIATRVKGKYYSPADEKEYDELNSDIRFLRAYQAVATQAAAEGNPAILERFWNRYDPVSKMRAISDFKLSPDMGTPEKQADRARAYADAYETHLEESGLPPSEVDFMGDPFGHGRKRRKSKRKV
jgi:hypothetical protein